MPDYTVLLISQQKLYRVRKTVTTASSRQSTGISEIDGLLGGGLLPGKLTVILGATGIGKTQFGLQYLNAGRQQEGEPGIIFDMTSRGDAQNHSSYAERMFNWKLDSFRSDINHLPADVWNREKSRRDTLHLFQRSGKRVTIQDLEADEWKEWKAELNKKIGQAIHFFYGNFASGVRRCVIDGIEPTDRASDSFQFHIFEYVYQQILRKEYDWVARDLFRVHFRQHAEQVEQHAYNHEDIGCLMLCTTKEIMLDDLISRPIESGDVLSNANTIIIMGKYKDGMKMKRALHIAKHRGSACDESIAPFEITETGLKLT